MNKRKDNKKYTFTVEGKTEQWYFEWLNECINKCNESRYTVSIDAKVQQSPLKYAKKVNPIAVPYAVHVRRFQDILEQLYMSNELMGRSFRYQLGYSNFTFELWIVLHKSECNGPMTDRAQYLKPINKAFHEQFENLAQYKHEDNFKRCLGQLTLNDVRTAIVRSEKIMNNNCYNGISEQYYRNFKYYKENPSLTIWESVAKILKECELL